jgi:hypothetical protein
MSPRRRFRSAAGWRPLPRPRRQCHLGFSATPAGFETVPRKIEKPSTSANLHKTPTGLRSLRTGLLSAVECSSDPLKAVQMAPQWPRAMGLLAPRAPEPGGVADGARPEHKPDGRALTYLERGVTLGP